VDEDSITEDAKSVDTASGWFGNVELAPGAADDAELPALSRGIRRG